MDKILTKKEEEMMAVLWEQWEHNQAAALTSLKIEMQHAIYESM